MSRDEKTLIVLSPGFPSSEADTTCLPFQQSFVRTMKEVYPNLNIIVLAFQYPYTKDRYEWLDSTVVSFDGRNRGGLSRLLLRRRVLKILEEVNKSTKIIGLLSFWLGECALVGKRFADKHRLKHYCWIMGQDARKGNKYLRRTNCKTEELIALSDFLVDEFEKNYGLRPKHLVPAGVDPKLFPDQPFERVIDILGVGSLIPLKQYSILIEVIAEIKKQSPGIRSVILGSGPQESELQSLISRYGLESNVSLKGELPHPEVLQAMQRAKLFLHPSSYEGFSGVCLEALYAGCHVISFTRAMKQQIEHWDIVNTKEEMIEKSLSILKSPPDYNRVAFMSMDLVARKIMELFAP